MTISSRIPTADDAQRQNQAANPSSSILNPNPQLLPGPKLLHSLLRLDEPRRADLPALECLSPSDELHIYSYSALNLLVQSLAAKIRQVLQNLPADVQSQQIIIPVLVPQSPALYISQFAVLQAGAAFCPINLDAPAERIKFISNDVNAKIIISIREFEDVLKWEGGPEVIFMEGYPDIPSKSNGQILAQKDILEVDMHVQGKLAYVMYTSGSTGQPKGVAISHLAVTQSLLAHDRHIPTFRRFLQFAAPSFDVSVFEIFFPLFRGATLVGCDRSKLLNDLCGIINKLNVDAAELTPTVAGSLVQKRERVPRLKLLLTIGEMLTNPVVKEFGANDEEGREGILYGMYGPTEAAIHCTVNPLMASSSPVSNIGIPFDVVTAFIAKVPNSDSPVDNQASTQTNLEVLDFGEVGELILAGPQLAEGYLNRPEQNAAAFVTYDDRPAYRTGDKARILPNGTIEMMGRISSGQVKLRGQRVELGEIEQAIFKHDDIQAAFCSILHGILVAFIRTSNPNTRVEDIQGTCKQWLPQFMIPSDIILLPEFPYLPSGKIDRKKLQADYEASRLEDDSTETEELSEVERQISDALVEIFGAKIGKTARLASAGLDSLRAIQLRSKLADVGLRVTPVEILGAENVEALAASCRREVASMDSHSPSQLGRIMKFYEKDETASDLMKAVLQQLPSDMIDAVMPCTPLQLAMLSETARNRSAYRNWVELHIKAFPDLDRLINAINLLAQRNEILRTRFIETPNLNDDLVQVVFKDLTAFQVVEVEEFSYNGPQDDDYLQHPLQVQIRPVNGGFKLLFHMHHALYDAWSLELMLDDLDSLLAKPDEQLTPRKPFSLIVSDCLARANDEENSQRSIDYWEAHLSQLDPLPLPNFHTLFEPSPSFEIAQLNTSISTGSLEAAARGLGVSSQSFFQAAFAILLGSYVGSTDVCIGTVFSGRTLPIPGIENIVGPCLATLPVRIDLNYSTSRSIQSLIQKLNGINRQHLEHSTLPLRDIKKACGADPARSLFDTLLVWQQTLRSSDDKRELVEVVAERDYLEFSLTLEITPGAEVVHIKANYRRALFPEAQVDFLLRQMEGLVAAFISKQGMMLEDTYSYLDDGLLAIDNTDINYKPPQETLASDVETMAAREPDRPAIEFARSINGSEADVDRATYGRLNFEANQIAECLIKNCNALPDELICICMEKSVSLYASILAVMKAGAGYLPITPETPLDRIRYIVKEAKVKTILVHSSHQLDFDDSIKVVYVDKLESSSKIPINPTCRSLPNNLAYAVFTSGSTGTPKGVLVTQGNLVSNLDVLQKMYPADRNTRLLQSCSQAFDVSVFEIFFTWRVGGCLCSATKNTLFLDIENAIRVLNVSNLSLTPTVASLIDPDNVPNVKFLVAAGEAVTEKVKRLWQGRGLWQGYGPSEMTNICTIRPQISSAHFINNIGPAFTNTSVFVLRPHSSSSAPDEFIPVPRGGDGEFCFGGTQVFRGYLNSEQNVGKIIMHPKYGKVYRSGDFGRILPDGSLAFTGRKDDQVKIRGQRVELGEINRTLLREKLVKDCVTLVVDSEAGQQRLISFWTSSSEEPNDKEKLRSLKPQEDQISNLFDALEASLPAYMVPSSLIPVSILPSSTQGKIDKRLLISHYKSLSSAYLNTTSKVEKSISDYSWTDLDLKLVAIVADITKVPIPEISPETSFFALGIDSISAIQVTRRLREAGAGCAEISDVLKFPSVARLSKQIARKSSSHSNDSELQADSKPNDLAAFKFDQTFINKTTDEFKSAKMGVVDVLPCTPLQEAMLSAAESGTSAGDGVYSNHIILDVKGNWNHLRRALSILVSRHEILRTCFVRSSHPRYAYAQVVLSPETCKADFHHLKDLEETASTDEFVRAVESINTARGPYQPAYTFGFTKSSETGSVGKLIVSMHHALYDGVAMGLLFEEVERLHRGEHDQLPKPVSFKPFLDYMTSLDISKADGFWDSLLKDFVPAPFPKILSSSSQPSDLTGSVRLSKTSKLSLSLIDRQTKDLKTSLLAVCQTSWAALLSMYLHETDICFGNVISGRSVPVDGVETLIAPCFNTIPVRLSDLQKLSYLECFRRLQAINADSLAYQLTPLRRIQSRNSPEGTKLFDTLIILQQPSKELDNEIWRIEEDVSEMDVPLVCEVVQDKGRDRLEIVIHAKRDLVSKENVEVILAVFENIFTRALKASSERIADSSFIDNETIELLPKSRKVRGNKLSATGVSEDQGSLSKNWSKIEADVRDALADFTEMPPERIQKSTSVFRLGLDSISAVQVAAQLRKQGYQVLASDILQRPTIAKIAGYLEISQGVSKATTPVSFDFKSFADKHIQSLRKKLGGINGEKIEKIRPCTPVQTGMIAQTLHSGGKDYINGVWMELLPDTDLQRLKMAWEIAVRKHEMLRTGFIQVEDLKFPFVMVTFASGYRSIWQEDNAEDQSSDIAQMLLQRPWGIKTFQNSSKTSIHLEMHHALYDAQSLQLILSDVIEAYNCSEGDSLLSSVPIDPLVEAIIVASTSRIEEQRSFWSSEENKLPITKFPDLTPLRLKNSASKIIEKTCSLGFKELGELCKEQNVTLQAAGQAAWGRLLAAYCGESVVTFGVTLSGRSISTVEDAENIAFPSIVTLPVRCEITGSNEDVLTKTMALNGKLSEFQFTPLSSIQRWAGYPEGKIFDTLFALQKLAPSSSAHDGRINSLWKVTKEEAAVDYAVSIELEPTSDNKVLFRLTFKESLVPNEHAELILEQFDMLLKDLLQAPRRQSTALPKAGNEVLSITQPSEPTILIENPVTAMHQFVEQRALSMPNSAAFEFATDLQPGHVQKKTWTYKQLDEESNRIAHMLLASGIEQGGLVGICFDKCPEASFAILGILKSGCSYVALDPTAPIDRLEFILQDSEAKIVLTAGTVADKLRANGMVQIVSVDKRRILEKFPLTAPKLLRPVSGQDTCYCLYTSGTTGTPKGCEITHENAVQAMLAFQRLFAGHWQPDSKWLQFASFHFDVSVLELFWSWSVGICVTSAPRDLIFEDIPSAIRELGVTHIDLTPSLARLLTPDDVPSLCRGVFITGGESLKQEILDNWGEKCVIYNGYGPTEATIGVTMYPRVPVNGNPANIGPAFDNVGSFVLKPGTSEPVLRGAIGELCVSGKLVGKGYLKRPELTKERFAFLENFKERVYRTGDLVRILHNGDFIFLGRADDQVKLRGQRLELSEINEVMKKGVDGLKEVSTLVLKHAKQQKEQLVTFFVPSELSATSGDSFLSGSQIDSLISKLREACKARLPGYMVPTHFLALEKFPLNSNNKTDNKTLAKMYNELTMDALQSLTSSSNSQKAWTDAEMRIVKSLSEVFQIDPQDLTRDMNIFQLGIDSITVIGLARKLQNAGFANAKLATVMSTPVIGNLVEKMLAGSNTNASDAGRDAYLIASQKIAAFSQMHMIGVMKELGVERDEIECVAPCTPLQEGMIFQFLESERPVYVTGFDFELGMDVDVERLERAWKMAVQKVQILRTRFVMTSDGVAQVVVKSNDLSWRLRQGLEDGSDEVWRTNIHEDYCATLKKDISGSPFEVTVVEGFRRKIMSLQIFHAIYDGNSLSMILKLVSNEYSGMEIQPGPSFHDVLPHGPLATVRGAKDYWQRALQSSRYLAMPSLTTQKSKKSISVSLTVTGLEVEKIAQRLNSTSQAVLQAAWASVLCFYLAQGRVTFGMVISGRAIDFEDADQVIGPLFNTVPFQVEIKPTTTWTSLIQDCHDYNTKSLPYQHTPLRDIQKWCGAGMNQPIFDTLFVFQHDMEEDDLAIDNMWTPLPESDHDADYPLNLEARLENNGEVELLLVGQGSIVDEVVATELLEKLDATLMKSRDLESLVNAEISPSSPSSSNSADSYVIIDRSESPSCSFDSFIWTDNAKTIRSEIISLAQLEDENFDESKSIFEFGLDSIDVIKLSSRLRKKQINIPVSIIIKCQNIAKMTEYLSSQSPIDSLSLPEKTIKEFDQALREYLARTNKLPDGVVSVLPATPIQEAMIAEMVNSNYTRYFNHEILKLGTSVDLGLLKTAWMKVIDQSEILRTTFAEIDEADISTTFAQIIRQEPATDVWEIYTTSGEPEFDALIARATEKAKNGGSLLQLTLVNDHHDNHLILSIAHALYDGSSLQMLHEDVWKAYHGKSISRPDHKVVFQQILNTNEADATNFWKTFLSGSPIASFPQDPKNLSDAVHREEQVSTLKIDEIQAFCKGMGISLQTIGQTCWALVLASYLKRLDVVFGAVLSCRDSEEANEMMFPFMNTVAVRSIVHGTLAEMLQYMQESGNAIRQYQHFPLRKAQALAGAGGRLFDTLFIYQGRQRTSVGDSQSLYSAVGGASEVEYPVCVEMEIVGDELVWRTACKDSALSAPESIDLLHKLDQVLNTMIRSSRSDTISSSRDGLSICGQSCFQEVGVESKPVSEQQSKENHASPWSATEKIIRAIVSKVSQIPEHEISKEQSIYNLGLDSISAIKVSSLLRREGLRLTVGNMVKYSTISAMAVVATPTNDENFTPSESPEDVLALDLQKINRDELVASNGLDHKNIEQILPLSAGQQYMFRRWQGSKGALFYPTFEYRIAGLIDDHRMATAWKNLQSQLPILRTLILQTSDRDISLAQVILKESENPIIQLSGNDTAENHKRTKPNEPLVALMLRASDRSTTLYLQIHHSLYDGVSLPLITQRLQDLYNGSSPPKTNMTFPDFLAKNSSSKWRNARQGFWKSYLGNKTDNLSLFNAGYNDTRDTRTEIFQPAVLTSVSGLKSQARKLGVSVEALLLASFAKIYSQNSRSRSSSSSHPKHHPEEKEKEKEDAIILGIYLANRSDTTSDTTHTLPSPTLNLLPLLIPNASSPTTTTSTLSLSIQSSLQKISQPEIAGTSLQEIYEWTGVRVNCFVNILKLPLDVESLDDEDESESESQPQPQPTPKSQSQSNPTQNIKIIQDSIDITKSYYNTSINTSIKTPPRNPNNPSNYEAYLPSIDIEIGIVGEVLNIGVFAPSTYMSLRDAVGVVEGLREELVGLVEGVVEGMSEGVSEG